jgi:hypothetical protein
VSKSGRLVMGPNARWEVDAFLAELPPRLADYAELSLWRIDRIATLARHVQHELDGNTDDESAVVRELAVAAEALCWHPGEREAVEQYLAAQCERLALLQRQLDG